MQIVGCIAIVMCILEQLCIEPRVKWTNVHVKFTVRDSNDLTRLVLTLQSSSSSSSSSSSLWLLRPSSVFEEIGPPLTEQPWPCHNVTALNKCLWSPSSSSSSHNHRENELFIKIKLNWRFSLFRKPQRSELANLLWAANMRRNRHLVKMRKKNRHLVKMKKETEKIKKPQISTSETSIPIVLVPHFSTPAIHVQHPYNPATFSSTFHINGACLMTLHLKSDKSQWRSNEIGGELGWTDPCRSRIELDISKNAKLIDTTFIGNSVLRRRKDWQVSHFKLSEHARASRRTLVGHLSGFENKDLSITNPATDTKT